MEMETKRLNPLSLRDWQYCFESAPNTRTWGVAIAISSVAIGVLLLVAMSDILNAIPEGAGKGIGGPLFAMSLVVGALVVGFLVTNLYMAFTAAAFYMARGERALDEDEAHGEYPGQPVTGALAEAHQPHEAASTYAVDCSITVLCHGCGKEICLGCGNGSQLNFFDSKAVAWCRKCTGTAWIPG